MSAAQQQRYLVRRLDEFDSKPCPEAAFLVAILNDVGEGETCVYYGRDSHEVLAVFHADKGRLPAAACHVPVAVIEAALRQPAGAGADVDENGAIVRPNFYPPE